MGLNRVKALFDSLTVIESNIVDNQVTQRKTSFIKSLNIFDGKLVHGKYLSGSGVAILSDPNYYMAAVPVEPNTAYAIFIGENIGKEDNYYWFKMGSSTQDVNTVLTQSNSGSVTLDGNVHFSNTSTYQQGQRITTGANDKSLFVLVSKYTPKSYVEIAKGTQTLPLYGSYTEGYKNFDFWVYNKDEVYSKNESYSKNEINSLISKAHITKVGNVCTITTGKASYVLKRDTNAGINLDTWRIYSGDIINLGNMWTGTDIEGPILERGAADFVGGYHGDEVFSSVSMLCDGTILDVNTDYDIDFNKLSIFVTSTVFHCNTSNPAFTRHKKLEFEGNTLTVSNRLDCLSSFNVERYCGCGLFSIYKSLLSYYSDNVSNNIVPVTSGTVDTSYVNSNQFDSGELYGAGFSLNMKVLTGKTSDYYGTIQDFATEQNPRYKIYFDAIRNTSIGYQVNVGDVLKASFSITIK